MIDRGIDHFRDVWVVDFEFHQPDGDRPMPICMVAREYRTGRTLRLWQDELTAMASSPFSTDADALFVAYYASAELGCFSALGWPTPARVLDLFVEFRNLTNGLRLPCGNGLLGALAFLGLDAMAVAEKEEMRQLAIRGGPYSDAERQALMLYCESDVIALTALLSKIHGQLDLPRALVRGRFMPAAAKIEWAGVPIDMEILSRLKSSWARIQSRLITEVDRDFGIYEAQSFKVKRFASWLTDRGIPWPQLESGALDLSDDAFRQAARQYPIVAPIRELRQTLSQLRLNDLAVGSDGRNRCLLSVFRARTSRNQPSNSKFIFGPSCWLRGLIRPKPGRALAYIDWEQQEFGIAAALSGDKAMMEAYTSGDPYLTFAKQAAAVPSNATKVSHPRERSQFKICALAVQYGMAAQSLARSLGVPEARGRDLLRLHQETYPAFWRWSEGAVNHAMLRGWLQTVFGWRVHVGWDSNPRSLANFPVQANGAEMLRLGCCLATEQGVMVCAPVHDALLIESTADEIDTTVVKTQAAMVAASRIVLSGFELRSEAKVIRWPERYMDERGVQMWNTIMGILAENESLKASFATEAQ